MGQNYFDVGQMRLHNIPRVCLYKTECSVLNHDRNTVIKNSSHLPMKYDRLMAFDITILYENFNYLSNVYIK